MEMVLFIGIQATGKSAFYLEKFYRTHVRINGDMLKTRRRENLLIKACLEGKTPFVVDKMNLTRADRAAYIGLAKAAGFKISGYFFESDLAPALQRNARRDSPERIPEGGVRAASKALQSPCSSEGFDQLFAVRMDGGGGFNVEALPMHEDKSALDVKQSASAAQFNRQSDRYGKSHILADTQDVEHGLHGVLPLPGGAALDVATGGGHTALWLARHGWKVTVGDIAPRMLENAQKLCAEAGFGIESRLFPAEEMPFADGSFDLVTVRVAPHHFSSPQRFVQEAARVLRPGGHFLLIDGTVPDDDPETDEWLHHVEKWRDPSHGRFLSRKAWQDLAEMAGLKVIRSDLQSRKQPDLNWYFDTAATSEENREKVLEAVAKASEHVTAALRLGNEEGKIIWWWPMLTLLACRE
jgi:ubiquinone/menaquinone biosynthesis C-methylase UbiE/predicted kinase